MTSKISSVKLCRESIKRSSAMGALMALVYFCILPLSGMVLMNDYDGSGFGRADILEQLRVFLAFNPFLLIVTMLFAAVMGILQFSYLHSKEKLDFYHSFPVRRERYFIVNYAGGVIQWALPYAVNLFLVLCLATLKGYADGQLWLLAWQGMLIQFVSYLLLYSCMVLIMLLTGKVFAAVLGMGVACVYVPAVLFLQEGLHEIYFTTYLNQGDVASDYLRLSPVYACMELMKRFESAEYSSRDLGLGMFLTAVLAAGVGVYLYRIRGSENAGHTMAFSGIARVVKFLLVVPISLLCNILFYAIGENVFWGFFGLVFGFVLSTALVEFIYCMDLREVFSDKRQILLTFAVTFFILMFYQFDLSSYDKKLPAQDTVESVEFNQYGTGYYGPYASMLSIYSLLPTAQGEVVYQLEGYKEKEGYEVHDLDTVYALLAHRMDRPAAEQEKIQISVTYHLKNGSEKVRRYSFPEEVLNEYFEPIWADVEYKEHCIPLLAVDAAQVLDISIGEDQEYQGYVSSENEEVSEYVDPDAGELSEEYAEEIRAERRDGERMEFDKEQEKELFETLVGEMKKATLNELWHAAWDIDEMLPVLTVVYLSGEGEVCGDSFYVSDALPKTKALLEEWGYDFSGDNITREVLG